MKLNIKNIIILGFASTLLLQSQTPNFKWVNGANITNQLATYGSLGAPSMSNIPGARENSMAWSENNNLWLFGGDGYANVNSQGYLNDLWRYNTSTSEWTWMAGDSINGGIASYGTILNSSPSNKPGARQNGSSWSDENGNLWLFGGQVGLNSFRNDLWKYNTITNEWTWMHGSNLTAQANNYGTLGSPSATNVPGARYGALTWYENNHLWLFGGQGYNGSTVRYNDLWKFDIATNEWTWISGSNGIDQNGNYGTQGTASSANSPGSRQAAVTWVDNNNQLWLFGGYGFPASGVHGYLSDLWKYDVAANMWTWINGPNATAQPAVYGTMGVPALSNIPGARQMSISWKDALGDLWLFGGWGYIGPPFGRLNDLWKYEIANNEWTWISGNNAINQSGVYGTQNIASVANIPGARRMSISFIDTNSHCWMFGGYGYDVLDSLGLLNDLWEIDLGINVGIEEPLDNHISFYPNPSKDKIYVDGLFENEKLLIQNIWGEVVKEQIIEKNSEIDISILCQGIYFLQFSLHQGKRQKLIKE